MKSSLKKERLTLGGLILFTLMVGVILSSSYTRASSGTDKLTWNLPVSCTMSSNIATGSEHVATVLSGEHKEDIGVTTVTVVCNDPNGVDVYAIGSSGNTLGNTDLINDTDANYSIHTGVYSSGSSTSSWGMKLTNVSGDYALTPVSGKFGSYMQVPNAWTKVAYREANTDTVSGASFRTTYDVYANGTQPTGAYAGQVRYAIVHPDGADAPKTIADLEYMQDFAELSSAGKASVLSSMRTDTQYLLEDSRDNKIYQVAKLADGNIWMTQNLDLTGGTELSYGDTDFDSDYVLPTTSGWTVNNNKLILPASSESGFSVNNYAYVYNSDNDTNCYWTEEEEEEECEDDECEEEEYEDPVPCRSYYSWDAATLGSGRGIASENTDAPYSICPKGWRLPTAGSTTNDGWKRGDFYNLAINYGVDLNDSHMAYDSPFYVNAGVGTLPSFMPSGRYQNSGYRNVGDTGFYWASTLTDSTSVAREMYFFVGEEARISVAGSLDRMYGLAVRCLVDL